MWSMKYSLAMNESRKLNSFYKTELFVEVTKCFFTILQHLGLLMKCLILLSKSASWWGSLFGLLNYLVMTDLETLNYGQQLNLQRNLEIQKKPSYWKTEKLWVAISYCHGNIPINKFLQLKINTQHKNMCFRSTFLSIQSLLKVSKDFIWSSATIFTYKASDGQPEVTGQHYLPHLQPAADNEAYLDLWLFRSIESFSLEKTCKIVESND